jgi:hypothetical protein
MVTANKIGETTFTTPSDREVVMERVFDAPRTQCGTPSLSPSTCSSG